MKNRGHLIYAKTLHLLWKGNWFAMKRGWLKKQHIMISYSSPWKFTHIFFLFFPHNNTQEIHVIFQVLAKFYLRLLTYLIIYRQRSSLSFTGLGQSGHRITNIALFPECHGILPNIPYAVLSMLFHMPSEKKLTRFFFLFYVFLTINTPSETEGKFYFHVEIYSSSRMNQSHIFFHGIKSTMSLSFCEFSQMLLFFCLDMNFQNHILQIYVYTRLKLEIRENIKVTKIFS